jgi:hypothetical protein
MMILAQLFSLAAFVLATIIIFDFLKAAHFNGNLFWTILKR